MYAQLTDIETMGFVDGAHTVDTDTQLSKTDIETMGFVDGAHTVDTNTQLTNAEVAAAATAEGFVELVHTLWTRIRMPTKQKSREWDS